MREQFEQRLDHLREEARCKGTVTGDGVYALGGPMPATSPEGMPGSGYYLLPILKAPVWEWMIPLYFFVGGLAGMAALIAVMALLKGRLELTRVALWAAGIGALISPVLLTWDLGRPLRFINMLRVFKLQSPMSLGSWILTGFAACVLPGLALVEWQWQSFRGLSDATLVQALTWFSLAGAAMAGIFLATYTGALIAVTAVPAWNRHHLVLPFHFGMAGLGSAAALLELAGFRIGSLHAIGFAAASAETLVMLWLEVRTHGAVDRALHEGKSGWTLRVGEALEGPLSLILRCLGLRLPAAASFLLGALITRLGWISAGRKSALDPDALLAAQPVHPASRHSDNSNSPGPSGHPGARR